jgi:hypothetical protein
VIVLDGKGRIPESISPADLGVTVDGRARTVAWIRRVSRGPGALADAAARRESGSAGIGYVAEPSRAVVLVIDEPSLPIGGERAVIQGAAAFLDRLGISDRVAVVRLPTGSQAAPALSVERPLHREAVNRITGRIPPEEIRTDGVTPDSRHIDGNPMGARVNREDQPERPEAIAVAEAVGGAGGAEGLARVLQSIAGLPGRKIVAFYSSGLDDRASGRIATAARAAAAARATLFVFGVPVPRDPRFSSLDARLLAQLAAATGGVFVRLGRNPVRDLEPLAPGLDACVVIGIQPAPEDSDRNAKTLRVESRRPGLVVRAPAFVTAAAPAAGDLEPPAPPRPVPAPDAPRPEPYRGAGRLAPSAPPPARPSPPDPELSRILGRLGDYAQGYIGQYSAVVAEEDYKQVAPTERGTRRLRSDLLFVRSESAQEWISFRDVYEVDGKPVRDRDTRLQDLFLTPEPDAQAQLQAIKDESARYNIGPFERNINVPMYPLKVLAPAHRQGFFFSIDRAMETSGVKTWRVVYREHARPTLVRDRDGHDIPLQGSFVVEQATGAIVASEVSVARRDYAVSIVVRYARDAKLGMWLPAEMKETYRVALEPSSPGPVVLEGTARYANFRRFQVTTDVQVAPKK